jgi:hypothetical protein
MTVSTLRQVQGQKNEARPRMETWEAGAHGKEAAMKKDDAAFSAEARVQQLETELVGRSNDKAIVAGYAEGNRRLSARVQRLEEAARAVIADIEGVMPGMQADDEYKRGAFARWNALKAALAAPDKEGGVRELERAALEAEKRADRTERALAELPQSPAEYANGVGRSTALREMAAYLRQQARPPAPDTAGGGPEPARMADHAWKPYGDGSCRIVACCLGPAQHPPEKPEPPPMSCSGCQGPLADCVCGAQPEPPKLAHKFDPVGALGYATKLDICQHEVQHPAGDHVCGQPRSAHEPDPWGGCEAPIER